MLRPYSALTQCTFFQYTRTDKYYRSAGDIAASSIRTRRPVQTNLVTSAAHTTETRWHICILHVLPFTAACDSRARPVTGNIWWRNCISSQQLVSIAVTTYCRIALPLARLVVFDSGLESILLELDLELEVWYQVLLQVHFLYQPTPAKGRISQSVAIFL